MSGPPPGMTLEDAGALFDDAMELVRRGQCGDALRIARELESCRYTGAWEIEAAALQEEGDTEGAIASLKRGIAIKPVWRNGHLLGIYLSDAGRYTEALDAFEASLTMHAPQPKMTAYNKAIVLNRADRREGALALLGKLTEDEGGEEDRATMLARTYLDTLTRGSHSEPATRRGSRRRTSRPWRHS